MSEVIEMPVTVAGWKVQIDDESYERTYYRDPLFAGNEEAPDDRIIQLLAIYADQWVALHQANKSRHAAFLKMNVAPVTPSDYQVDPDNLVRNITTKKPYGQYRGYTQYEGTIYKKDGGSIYQADLEYARNHMRTPGQSCNMRYHGGLIRVSGCCDSTD